jgi:hypothetical protein
MPDNTLFYGCANYFFIFRHPAIFCTLTVRPSFKILVRKNIFVNIGRLIFAILKKIAKTASVDKVCGLAF